MNRREPTEKGIINGQNRDRAGRSHRPGSGRRGQGRQAAGGRLRLRLPQHHARRFYQWCGDYAGFAQIGIEKAFPGAVAMFWTGCGADANPQPRRKVELCEQHGKELADAVVGDGEGRTEAGHRQVRRRSTRRSRCSSTRFPTKAQLAADTLSKTVAVQQRAERLLKELEANGQDRRHVPALPGPDVALGDQILWVVARRRGGHRLHPAAQEGTARRRARSG